MPPKENRRASQPRTAKPLFRSRFSEYIGQAHPKQSRFTPPAGNSAVAPRPDVNRTRFRMDRAEPRLAVVAQGLLRSRVPGAGGPCCSGFPRLAEDFEEIVMKDFRIL